MTNSDKYSFWVKLVDYDIDTARIMQKERRYTHTVMLCHQAIERMLKGMYVFHTGREAPKSHNVPFLANKIADNEKFQMCEAYQKFNEEKSSFEDFMVDLMFYYMSDYPFSYKNFEERFIKEDIANDILFKTEYTIKRLKTYQ